MKHPQNEVVQQTDIQVKTKKRFLTPRRVLLVAAVLLMLNLSASSVFFARYTTASDQSDSARVAAFNPVISYGDEWESSMTFSGASAVMNSTLPFTVNTADTEVSTRAIVTIEHQGVLPLVYTLYACAADEIETATPLSPKTVSGNTIVWEVVMSDDNTPFSLAVDWRENTHTEHFNGLTDTMNVSVLCEQI